MDVKIIRELGSSFYTYCRDVDKYVERQRMQISDTTKEVCKQIPPNDLCLKCEKRMRY